MPRGEVRRQTTLPTRLPSHSVSKSQSSQMQSIPAAPSFGQLIKEGIGFGAGQAIAHRAVNAIIGPSIVTTPTTPVAVPVATHQGKCATERNAFELCLKTKSQEDHCADEILSYKQCIELN